MSTDLVDYIFQEAKEKALEIEIEARKEYESKLYAIASEKKAKIETKYEFDDANRKTEYLQEYSKVKNKIKTNRLIARNKAMVKLLNQTQISLLKKCKSDTAYYTQLMKKLIVEVNLLVPSQDDGALRYCLLFAERQTSR